MTEPKRHHHCEGAAKNLSKGSLWRSPHVKQKHLKCQNSDSSGYRNEPRLIHYINFAWIGNTILFPQFGLKEDAEALALIQQLIPENKVVPVECAELAYYGGVLNCCTWIT